MLFYNNSEHFPFLFSRSPYGRKWNITTDRHLCGRASVVVFHLPTLEENLSESEILVKKEGQVWVGWKQTHEPDIRNVAESVWDEVFDFYLNLPPRCYWKCVAHDGISAWAAGRKYRLPETQTPAWRKVDFMIVGTQKGGSTALHEYLKQHPSCWGSFYKETGFFLYPHIFRNGYSWYMDRMWRKRPPLRFSLENDLLFESSTWYSYWPEVPQRLYEYNPDLKIIFLVRNPVERAFSQYNVLLKWTKDKLLYEYLLYPDRNRIGLLIDRLLDVENYPFTYWVKLEMEKIRRQGNCMADMADFFPDFLHRGFYYEQLERYYRFFPKEHVLVIENGELENERIRALRRIEDFLHIPHIDWNEQNLEKHFVSKYETGLSHETYAEMANFFRPYNQKLFRLIGREYDWR